MSDKFIGNRNLYHTFSRVAIQEGQGVAAAVNKTGHTVTTNDVWSDIDKLPKNTAYFGNANTAFTDLKTVYDANSTEFSKYVKLYENVELSPVEGSGQDADKNQAWELLVDGKRIKNFIAPTDVFDENGQPCNGYTLKLFDKTGTQIAATDGNWAFDYVAGLVIFERGKTPQDLGWAGTTVGSYIKMSAWAYVGGYLTNSLKVLKSELNDTINNIGQTLMAVKPFKWDADTYMTYIYKEVTSPVVDDIANYYELVDGVYAITTDVAIDINKTYFVKTTSKEVVIPAVLFNVFNIATGLAFGDLEYQSDGSTKVVFEDWDNADFGDATQFIGYGFVLGNGNPITMLTLEELKNN